MRKWTISSFLTTNQIWNVNYDAHTNRRYWDAGQIVKHRRMIFESLLCQSEPNIVYVDIDIMEIWNMKYEQKHALLVLVCNRHMAFIHISYGWISFYAKRFAELNDFQFWFLWCAGELNYYHTLFPIHFDTQGIKWNPFHLHVSFSLESFKESFRVIRYIYIFFFSF